MSSWRTASSLKSFRIRHRFGDYPAACPIYEESLALWRTVKDPSGRALAVSRLGLIARKQGDYGRARLLLEEGLELQRQIGQKWVLAYALNALAAVELCEARYRQAREHLAESLALFQELGARLGIAETLEVIARVAVGQGQCERAVQVCGAAQAQRVVLGIRRGRDQRPEYAAVIATARAELDEPQFATAWAAGRAMTLEQAIAYALDDARLASARTGRRSTAGASSEGSTDPTAGDRGLASLTRREHEVLRLVAHGLRTREVAVELGLSPLTVNVHLRAIYRKLGVRSRTAAARVAMEQHLE